MLKSLLPDDEIIACPPRHLIEKGREVHVIIPLMHRLEPELIRTTGATLIHQWGVGLEGVDIPAATSRGILVCNVPADVTANADSTAEHAVFLMFGLARRIHQCFRAFDEGRWGAPLGDALLGQRALVVGLGMVGKALVRKLTSLGMTVEAIRRSPNPDVEQEIGLTEAGGLPDLCRMASQADFVISTISLNDQTRGIFEKDLFKAMKPTAFLVNVSRGPVVNEQDLLEALQQGLIAGAGLDVYCQEPVDPNHPFLSMENVFATPHVAGATRQNYEGISRVLAENILKFKEGKMPLYCVNKDDLPAEQVTSRETPP
ncbi:MAG: hydroxyacid dehydrogenase [Desulfomonile tiedjei]|nr:hydroxyacid dehydrogenase [Desulfomonile tiedjei]